MRAVTLQGFVAISLGLLLAAQPAAAQRPVRGKPARTTAPGGTIGPLPAILPTVRSPADGVYSISTIYGCLTLGLTDERGEAPVRFTSPCVAPTQFRFRYRMQREDGSALYSIQAEGSDMCLWLSPYALSGTLATAQRCGSDASFYFPVTPTTFRGIFLIGKPLCLGASHYSNQPKFETCGEGDEQDLTLIKL